MRKATITLFVEEKDKIQEIKNKIENYLKTKLSYIGGLNGKIFIGSTKETSEGIDLNVELEDYRPKKIDEFEMFLKKINGVKEVKTQKRYS